MHWGAFHLTDEAYDARAEALSTARAVAGVSPEEFLPLPLGVSLSV
jgi:hypothetical protein